MSLNNFAKLSMLSLVVSTILCAQDSNNLDSITVTANKVEENIQNVPQSITVIDEETLKIQGIDTIDKIMTQVPNMSSSNISGMGTSVNFRGINTSLFNTFSSPVVVYVDGIPSANKYVYQASLNNAKSVEVLRGPQGTMYGKDSIGSVINIITKDSPEELNGEIGIEGGSKNYQKITFNINAPLIENKLYAGINADFQKDDGNVTNTYLNDDKSAKSDSSNVNAYFKYLPTDNLSLKFTANKYSNNDDGSDSATYTSSLSDLSESSYSDTKSASYDVESGNEKDVRSYSFSLNYDFDKFFFDWVSTYKDVDFDSLYDHDFSDNITTTGTSQFTYLDTKAYTNEFRLSNNEDNFAWLLGLYLDNEKVNQSIGQTWTAFGTFDASGKLSSKTQALFAQSIFPLNTKLDLTLGARYQHIEKDVDLDVVTFGSGDFNFAADDSWDSFLPKIALSYKNSDTLTSFASISKGYMPGGYATYPSSNDVDNYSFEEQTSMDYEIGIKGAFNDIIFNASIFYMDINDLQVNNIDSNTGAWYTNNADSAHSYGLELEGKYFINDNLDLNANIGLIKAVYDNYTSAGTVLDGKNIENTPSHTINLSLSYKGNSGLYSIASIYNRGSISFYDASTQKFLDDGSATTADIKVGKKFSNLNIYAYVNNITDEHYVTNYFSKGNLASVSYNEGRFVGVGARYKF